MKFKNPMLVVSDIEKSRKFYKEVLGLNTVLDLGTNITLSGGIILQAIDSWADLILKEIDEINYSGNDVELYFEEDFFDDFIDRLKLIENIDYIHPVLEHRWGQRVVRFYDLDKHIIEVGENIEKACNRFLNTSLIRE